eukprot:4418220-Amphidinium_carterae.1
MAADSYPLKCSIDSRCHGTSLARCGEENLIGKAIGSALENTKRTSDGTPTGSGRSATHSWQRGGKQSHKNGGNSSAGEHANYCRRRTPRQRRTK